MRRPIGIAAALLVAVGFCACAPQRKPVAVVAAPEPRVLRVPEIQAYRAAVRAAERGAAPVEAAFAAFSPMEAALMRVIVDLPEEDYLRLESALPGTFINRVEVVFVAPDPVYFMRLASERGDDADCAFFAAYSATYPEKAWPVWHDRQTDFGGCTRYGSMSLVETYRLWTAFQRRFPGRYPAGAREEIDSVVEVLTADPACACGDLESIERELRVFVGNFPSSPPIAEVREHLRRLDDGQSADRANCVPG